MVDQSADRFLVAYILTTLTLSASGARLGVATSLRSLGSSAMNFDYDSINLKRVAPEYAGYTVGTGVFAFRSGVISSLSQLDRGEKEAAMETLRVTIATLTMETTQTFGLPVMSAVIDKIFNKYGTRFPRTVRNFKSYNQMLGSSILSQANNVAAPGLLDEANAVVDQLDTLKNQIKTDFAREVTSVLESSQAYDDLVTSLQNAKTWAKVGKWTDFLLGPIFDAANIAFAGWQLHQAIQAGDELSIASGSLGIVSSVVGIGSFVIGSLATAGSVLAATAGPIGAIIGCILTLASLIIDLINQYNPTQKINRHLELVRSLTAASKDMLSGAHKQILEKATSNGVNAGFSAIFEINQAMLVKASISDPWDTIRGFNNLEQDQLEFKQELITLDADTFVVGDMRVFDQKFYQNWLFKPEGREEIGYSYYGKEIYRVRNSGLTIRLNTDMVTNSENNMWFWLNGVKVTTYFQGQYLRDYDDNVNIGDFRTLWMSSGRMVEVHTGGGNDLIQISGVICAAEQQQRLDGKCLLAVMGPGYDIISFEGMDQREEKLKWFLSNNDLSQKKMVTGISFDMINFWLSYKLKGDDGSVDEVRFGGVDSVEGFIGSPLDDVVKFSNDIEYYIKESSGDNTYEFYIRNEQGQFVFIEDNSDTPGHLIIHREGIGWDNVLFRSSTNLVLILYGEGRYAEVLLKRCKPGLENFRVTVGNETSKTISQIQTFDDNTGILFPYVPYSYYFDRNLAATITGDAYVSLLLPKGRYPRSKVSYTFQFAHAYNKIILSGALLSALRNNSLTLKAHRRGPAEAEGRWFLALHNDSPSGGWEIELADRASIVVGPPGALQFICMLATEQRHEINLFHEYQTIMQEIAFDSTTNVYGRPEAEKLLFTYPFNLAFREPVDHFVIDMKGPPRPTDTDRNELVMDDRLITTYFKHNLRMYMKMELKRESLHHHWVLNIYSNWSRKTLRVVVLLKHVDAIIGGSEHHWKLILNLFQSRELYHDLNQIMLDTVGLEYFSWS